MNKITNAFIKIEVLFILFCLILGASLFNHQDIGDSDFVSLSASALTNPGKQQKSQLRPTFTPTPVLIKISQVNPTLAATPKVTPTQPRPTSTPFPTASASANTALPQAVVQIAANIRSGPGTDYGIVGGVQTNTRLQLIGRNVDGSWLRICCVADGEKWIYAQLVQIDDGTNVERISMPIVSTRLP